MLAGQFYVSCEDVAAVAGNNLSLTIDIDLQKKAEDAIAEVDLQESHTFAELGAAYVSNSRKLGEQVMNRILHFVESNIPGRVSDAQILSEFY